MIVDELKKSIYLSALKGELSKRLPDDSCVIKSLDLIIEQNNIDIKEIKRRKILNDEDIQYEIPENWKWVKLGFLCDVIRGLTFSQSSKNQNSDNVLVLRGGNIDSKTEKLIYHDNIYVDKNIPNNNQYLRLGDTLIVASSGTKTSVGKSAFIDEIEKNISFGGFMMVVRPYSNILNPKYLSYNIKVYRNKIINDTNGYISNITNSILNNLMIPLPPIEEQQRIVDKIEELFSKLDEIKLIEDQLIDIKANFSNDIKYSIIESAIRGSLSLNFPNEKPVDVEAYDCKLEFNIPENWKWAKINDVIDIQTGLSFKKTEQTAPSQTTLRILRGGNIDNNFKYLLKPDDIYVNYTDKYTKLLKGDVITPSVTSMEQIGKVGYIDKDLDKVTAGGFVYIMRVKDTKVLNPKYMMYFVNTKFHKNMCKPNIHKSGQAFYNLKKSGLILQPIPLPPIEEQQRIVNKLEQLLPICEDIEQLIKES